MAKVTVFNDCDKILSERARRSLAMPTFFFRLRSDQYPNSADYGSDMPSRDAACRGGFAVERQRMISLATH